MGSINKEIHKEKKNSITWKAIFIVLLIVNLIWGNYLYQIYTKAEAFGFVVFYPSLFVLAVIDIIAILIYVFKNGSHRKYNMTKRIIVDTVLVLVIFVLFTSGIVIYVLLNL